MIVYLPDAGWSAFTIVNKQNALSMILLNYWYYHTQLQVLCTSKTEYLLPHLRNLQSEISLLEEKGAGISRDDARKLDKLRNDRSE